MNRLALITHGWIALIGLSVGALVTSIDGSLQFFGKKNVSHKVSEMDIQSKDPVPYNDNPFVGSGEGGFVGFAGSGVAGADSGVG